MIRMVFDSPAAAAAWQNGHDMVMMYDTEFGPGEQAAYGAQGQRIRRNADWLQAHAAEAYDPNAGKYICVAGCELFVGDTAQEARARALAAHPDDDGYLLQYVTKETGRRLYGHSRPMVALP
jgi:hypothetical protein